MNLVNNKDLLKPRSFRLAKLDKVVEYKSLSLLINRYSKRVLKNLLNSSKGLRTKDLVLYNVIVVKGFFINIVLKACLIKLGVWYIRIDCLLRHRPKGKNITLLKLAYKLNIVFIKFKPLLTYLGILLNILLNAIGALIYLTLEQAIIKPYQRSYDYLKLRSDLKEVQHIRARHLGLRALHVLVFATSNVEIKGL